MRPGHASGPGIGVGKYDILTALALSGLHRSATEQISALRLIALITARYNWRRDELSMGQAEMARIWGVAERTAKREVRRLLDMGLLEQRRPGVRGRVASYRLNLAVLEALSRPAWDAVGEDFRARAEALLTPAAPASPAAKVLRVDFGAAARPAASAGDPDARWRAVLHALAEEAPEAHANWYSRLALGAVAQGEVEVVAPNGFVQSYVATHLAAALRRAVAASFEGAPRVVLTLAG